jgi:hypothetical protein
MLDHLSIDMKERNNIIRMYNLTHNQLPAPRFKAMIKHSWYKCGYLEKDPGYFENLECIFFGMDNICCSLYNCDNIMFINCSWCSVALCFEHFFENFHVHNMP